MRDLNGDNYGSITDNSTTIVCKSNVEETIDTPIEKEEVSLKRLFIEKVFEGALSVIFSIVTYYLYEYWESEKVLELSKQMRSISLLLLILFCILAFVYLLSFLTNLIKLLQLRKKGKFVEFKSKGYWVRLIVNSFYSYFNSNNRQVVNKAGKSYKNIDGKLYLIKTKKCPLCESEPIGNMHLVYNSDEKRYIWICSEQHLHSIEFDFKKAF